MNELGQPLGLIDQQYWTRKGSKDFVGKESLKWSNGLKSVNKQLKELDKKVVLVQDREADIFNFFKAEPEEGIELLVRVHQPRNMAVLSNGAVSKLASVGEHLQEVGSKEVMIERNHQEVKLTLSLKAGAVNIFADKDLSIAKHQTEGLSLVIAEEIDCVDIKTGKSVFKEGDKVIWYLLTSLSIENQEDAARIVHFYALRWRIERLHYTLKSGALNVEKLQFDDIESICNALAFYSIVAWQVLAWTYFVRQEKEAQASTLFDETEIEILEKQIEKSIWNA